MKQFITLQQWAELSEKEMKKHQAAFAGLEQNKVHGMLPRDYKKYAVMWKIGEMIEFLGDDYLEALVNYCDAEDVCDSLYEAVKEKLND